MSAEVKDQLPQHMIEVPLDKAYRLLNHGPTVLITSALGGQRDVMAAAWAMAVDFFPAKLVVVIDKSTLTRYLITSSGQFGISIPSAAQIDLTNAVGNVSGRDIDKFAAFDIATFPARTIAAPHVANALAWLECEVIPEPGIGERHDMIMAIVTAAAADSRAFAGGHWIDGPEEFRTIHHVAGGNFFIAGAMRSARAIVD